MRMEIRDESKIVELWLTREEKDDLAFWESLKPAGGRRRRKSRRKSGPGW